MSLAPFQIRVLLLGAALQLCAHAAGAQAAVRSASVAVSLRVLAQASFDGSTIDRLSVAVVPGQPIRVDPAAGVRTRMTYTAATQVAVSGGPLRGSTGAILRVRFACTFGDGMSVSAAEPFDCVGGILDQPTGGRATTIPIAIGAELSASETMGAPPGVYVGLVTLTATYPNY